MYNIILLLPKLIEKILFYLSEVVTMIGTMFPCCESAKI